MGHVVQHAGQDAAGTAGGGRYNAAAGCVFLTHRQGVGEHQAAGTQAGLVPHGLYVVHGGLAGQVERSGQAPFRIESPLHGGLHGLPYLLQVGPDFRTFHLVHIFPHAPAVLVAPGDDFREGVHVVHLAGLAHLLAGAFGQRAAADGIHRPVLQQGVIGAESLELHGVGMVFQENPGAPVHLDGGDGLQGIQDGDIRHVPLAGSGQGTIQRDVKTGCVRMPGGKQGGSSVRAHRM